MSALFTLPAPSLPPPLIPFPTAKPSLKPHLLLSPTPWRTSPLHRRRRRFVPKADDGDVEAGSPDEYDMEEEEVEEVDNKKDYDVDYDRLLALSSPGNPDADLDEVIHMVQSKSFVSTQGWDPEMVVDYRINEEEFHKISLLDCDFFIRKPPDPDDDVYDFREVF